MYHLPDYWRQLFRQSGGSQEQEEREFTVRSILLRDGQVLAGKGSPYCA